MNLFLSTFIYKVDKKARLSIPAPFRTILAQQSIDGIIALKSPYAPMIECFHYQHIEKLAQKIEQLPLYSDQHQDLTLTFFADVVHLPFDKEGRVTLPESLITHAHLQNDVAIVGRGHTFQIWQHENFIKHHQTTQQRLQQQPQILGITLS